MHTSHEPDLLSFAVECAHRAGVLVLELVNSAARTVEYKRGSEPVTPADSRSDALIGALISERFPDHRILSEEAAWSKFRDDMRGPVWIVDPIDGTANFARGHRYYSISIAFCLNGTVQCGVVHAPSLGETFTAVSGGGAHLNGAPISVSGIADLSRSVISTGFPHNRDDISTLLARVGKLLTHCQDIRRAASPALDLCWVACGRLDAHTESLAPWDHAAGGLIAVEAGATRANLPGAVADWPNQLNGADLVVSAPGIHNQLMRLLS
ncbi:inositol monophosphatase family protein [Nocardia suismassiliense]|uniref:inositol monophosphatase family protein n=1 Tax=Nocardia suismassiliense TaxID=2077092 RepID=UPI00131F1F14|nr:inositol monophosphatase family protein [Nocardia suismassiliense]